MPHTIHTGDARSTLEHIEHIDVVITDPPYGIGFPYRSYKDNEDNLKALISETMPLLLSKAARIVITPGITNMHLYPKPDWVAAWTWETTATYGALGYNQWQPIFVYGPDLKGFGSVNGQLKSDRIHFNGGAAKIDHAEGQGHTCPKPLAFVERLILRFSEPGDVICDPFAGSGTTGVAAANTGRSFVGIELDPEYAAIADRRVSNAYAQPRLFQAASPEKRQHQPSAF